MQSSSEAIPVPHCNLDVSIVSCALVKSFISNHTSVTDCRLVCPSFELSIPTFSLLLFLRSDLVEKNAMLRTKAMREKEEQRERRKYNYTLLRIRLPDGNLLQGKSFSARMSSGLSESFVENPVRNERLRRDDVHLQGPFTRGTVCLCCSSLYETR